ncbi:MAG TPA: hypothetical protein VFR90_04060 [Methylibium sp.]|uniref:hypothetical protein n=1 Tax=Methylibium sp. TaxID=2067992 RepID=UPI002DB9B81C|nr:hypothetical protein [Methylibium sp.]HEU4458274.1 hypothetical protein [Methylibium sp.]
MRPSRGQATSEFLVACLVIVPLLLLVPMVGKYIDLTHAAELASRYVAFEGTVHLPGSAQWKSDATLSADVRRRFFSESSSQIRTGEAAIDIAEQRNVLWTSPWGRTMLPERSSNVAASASLAAFNQHAPSREAWHADMRLPEDNLVIGRVSVRPANLIDLPAPFDRLDLSISRRTAVLADAWTGRDDHAARNVVERMRLLYPINALPPRVREMTTHFSGLLGDPELPFGLRRESYQLLPCDRLAEGC